MEVSRGEAPSRILRNGNLVPLTKLDPFKESDRQLLPQALNGLDN